MSIFENDCMDNLYLHLERIFSKEGYTEISKMQTDFFKDFQKFTVDNKVIEKLSPEYTSNKVFMRKLPFNSLIILNTIKVKGIIFRGIQLGTFINDDKKEDIKIIALVQTGDDERYTYTRRYFTNLLHDKYILKDDTWSKQDDKVLKYLKLFCCNFLDFLNNPDVDIVDINFSKDRNIKRLKKGKCFLPDYKDIRISGSLKKYFDDFSLNSKANYSHRFWVRGHFRTLKSERYGGNVNKRLWITPYIKGEGILINKNRKVIKNDGY